MRMFDQIDHIGIAVEDLEKSLDQWRKMFNLRLHGIEEIKERGVKLAHLEVSEGPQIELISPLDKNSPVHKFLQKRGEGLHHVCFEVEDIHKALSTFQNKGVESIQDKPQKGAQGSLISFIHPRYFNGVLIELKQKKKEG